MESWSFLTSHAQVPLRITHDPGAQLRDIAAGLDTTGAAPTATSPTRPQPAR